MPKPVETSTEEAENGNSRETTAGTPGRLTAERTTVYEQKGADSSTGDHWNFTGHQLQGRKNSGNNINRK